MKCIETTPDVDNTSATRLGTNTIGTLIENFGVELKTLSIRLNALLRSVDTQPTLSKRL